MGMWGLLSGSLAGQDHCLYCEFKGRAIVWALQQCRPTSWAMHSSGAAGDSLTVQGCWLCSEVSWGLRLGSAIISGPWKFHATLLAEWCHWLDLAIGQGYQLVSAIVPAWVWSQAVVHQNLSTGCCKPHPSSPFLIPSGQALQTPPVSSMIQDHTTLGELDIYLCLSSHWRKCRLRLASWCGPVKLGGRAMWMEYNSSSYSSNVVFLELCCPGGTSV